MKTDINYLMYQLKSFLYSDFKSNEISSLLNDLEPEKYLQEYVLSLHLNKENEDKVCLRLRHILENAKSEHVPLSIEYEPYQNAEEAYLARQRYINGLVQKEQYLAFISKSIFLLSLTAICLLVVFIATA
ncbi:MAG: hypothetical protein IJ254_06215 [Succinivibrio sp.]|jgi:uncharacterized protein YdaL|nr:hypothetical protein [Succinivibrio sp.]